MNSLDKQYIALLKNIRDNGVWDSNRTGIDSKAIIGAMIQHDMSEGFPLLCCKKHPFKSISVELEFFLRGFRHKKWLQDRGCRIWDEWCNPRKVPYGTDEDSKAAMAAEDDLGRIYGVQWRGFSGYHQTLIEKDQIQELINLLKKDPTSRRAIVTSWHPCELDQMALPPCHVMWQVTILGGKLNLTWYQRSVDTPLGLPFNIASYGLLLHLLARELGYKEGTLTGMLNNVHYYRNQEEAVNEIIERGKAVENIESSITGIEPQLRLPKIYTSQISSLEYLIQNKQEDARFVQWTYQHSTLEGYNPLAKIEIPIAV